MSLQKRPAYSLYRWLWTGFDWLYPPNCGGCGKVGSRWCPTCSTVAKIIYPPFCKICGSKNLHSGNLCNLCLSSPPNFSALRSWAFFTGPVRNAIHRLKYLRDIPLGEILARPLIQLVIEEEWKIDLVIPVPLSVVRKVERGYNQAALLARPISLANGWLYQPNALIRVRDTSSQVGLSLTERLSNVTGAFEGNKTKLQNKHVLLVDDVTTSGATLNTCSEAMRMAGAREIYCVTVARAE